MIISTVFTIFFYSLHTRKYIRMTEAFTSGFMNAMSLHRTNIFMLSKRHPPSDYVEKPTAPFPIADNSALWRKSKNDFKYDIG